jgi:hypothetical protein
MNKGIRTAVAHHIPGLVRILSLRSPPAGTAGREDHTTTYPGDPFVDRLEAHPNVRILESRSSFVVMDE